MPEIKKIIDTCTSISTYFHNSGIRTRELKEKAEEKKLPLLRLPEYHEVRRTEFSLQLVNAILKSWQALIIYFQDSKDAEAKGYFHFLSDKGNLQLLTFLADVLEIMSRCQKNLQKNNISLIDMMQFVKSTGEQLSSLLYSPLLGGWVSALESEIETLAEDECKLKGIFLTVHTRRLATHNLFVSVRRNFDAIKNEVVQSLNNFLQNRFDEEEEKMIKNLEKFSKFDSCVNLKEIHKCIASDLDLARLSIEYNEILNIGVNVIIKNCSLIEKIKKLISLEKYPLLTTIFSRITAATPHSADVERLISCNNILKSSRRCSLDIETENLYLYVYFNMPSLIKWDPRPAVIHWLESKKRRDRSPQKATDQEWFKGIFEQSVTSRKVNEDQSEGSVEKKKSVNNKRCF